MDAAGIGIGKIISANQAIFIGSNFQVANISLKP
jgi:hypothetical protein